MTTPYSRSARPGRASRSGRGGFGVALAGYAGFGSALALLLMAATPVLAAPEGAAPRPFSPPADNIKTLYLNATLIDVRGGAALPAMAVITKGERIELVLPAASVTPAQRQGATVEDLGGAYLMPGLIDSHQHLATPPNPRRAEAQMRRDVFGGITAIRNMADDLRAVNEHARAARVGEIAGPDIYAAAIFAGPDFFDDPRTAAAAEGWKPGTAPWMRAIDDSANLPEAITLARGSLAIAVKLYDNLRPVDVQRITGEAHRQNMRVWAHGMVFPTAPADLVAAGVDAISHTCYMAYQISNPRPASYKDRQPVERARLIGGDNPEMGQLFADMAAKGIILDPTLRVYQEYDERLARNPAMKPKPYCSLDVAAALTAQAHRAGVTLVTGTDGVPGRQNPWPALYDEMMLLNDRAGLTAAEVLRAATLSGAQIIGQEADMGSIEAGKLANMVVLRQNPLADIANMRTIIFTVKRGARLNRRSFTPISPEEFPDD